MSGFIETVVMMSDVEMWSMNDELLDYSAKATDVMYRR
jgi:hypothetical protein